MSQATLHSHLHAVALAGYQQVLYRTYEGLLGTRNKAFRIWDRSTEAFSSMPKSPSL